MVAAVMAGGVAVAAVAGGGIRFTVVSPVTVQALGIDNANPAVGQPVTIGAKIVAESETTLQAAVIAVRDPSGATVDFPDVFNYRLGTTQKVFTQTGSFDEPGTYTYWFAYQKDGRWTGLEPRQTFTVGSGGPGPTPPADASASPTADPTASPSASPASSPSPSVTTPRPTSGGAANPGGGTVTNPAGSATGCQADPSRCGYPDKENTGVPAGVSLRVITGNYTATASVDGVEIRGCVTVTAPNVTISNSRVVGQCFEMIAVRASNFTLIDSEIQCTHLGTGVGSNGYTVIRTEISGCENGFGVGGNVTVRDSYIHDLDPCCGAHTDGAQFNQGAANITFEHNTILSPAPGGTSAIIMWDEGGTQNSNVRIANNLLAGGTYTLYCPRNNSSNVRVIGNRFGTAQYGASNSCVSGHVAEWSGNVKDSTGAPLGA